MQMRTKYVEPIIKKQQPKKARVFETCYICEGQFTFGVRMLKSKSTIHIPMCFICVDEAHHVRLYPEGVPTSEPHE